MDMQEKGGSLMFSILPDRAALHILAISLSDQGLFVRDLHKNFTWPMAACVAGTSGMGTCGQWRSS